MFRFERAERIEIGSRVTCQSGCYISLAVFGLGMWEIMVIFIVALLFLGPEKLPDAAKKLSQGIREFRQHGRELQRTHDEDTELGSAVRDLKSALRGDDIRAAVARYEHPDDRAARQEAARREAERLREREGVAREAGEDEGEAEEPVAPDPYARPRADLEGGDSRGDISGNPAPSDSDSDEKPGGATPAASGPDGDLKSNA